jgi:uncharacterized protein (TIRG00374 family)
MRRWLLLALKLGISAALLYFAFRGVDLAALGGHFARLDPFWIAAALAALALQIVLAGPRWSAIAGALGAALPAGRAIRFSAIAGFFNQALPSTVGGDAMRAWLLGRQGRDWRNAISSVIADRVIGVGFLSVIVAACLPWSFVLIAAPEGRIAVLVIGLGGVLGLALVLALGGSAFARRLGRWRAVRFALDVAAAVRRVMLGPRTGLPVALVSIIIHLLTVVAAWALARAVTLAPDPLALLILIPPVILISMVPISIGGWGIREGTMVVAFAYAGMARSEALAVSVLLGLAMLVLGAAGGLLWLAERGPPRRDPAAGMDRA